MKFEKVGLIHNWVDFFFANDKALLSKMIVNIHKADKGLLQVYNLDLNLSLSQEVLKCVRDTIKIILAIGTERYKKNDSNTSYFHSIAVHFNKKDEKLGRFINLIR